MKEIIFILGGPGSGKGTQCQLLSEKFLYKHISAGDLLRAEKNKDTKYSNLINKYISNGKIVPSSITISLIMDEIRNCDHNVLLIDGFPRNLENLNSWNEINNLKIKYKCIFFDCHTEVLVNRLLKRGLDSGRDDDNLEVINKRLQVFKESTEPVLDYFRKHHILTTLDSNRNIEDTLDDLTKIIKKYLELG